MARMTELDAEMELIAELFEEDENDPEAIRRLEAMCIDMTARPLQGAQIIVGYNGTREHK